MNNQQPKLVRDNIPDLIEKSGDKYSSHTATDSEYEKLLLDKLIEEAKEAAGSSSQDLA